MARSTASKPVSEGAHARSGKYLAFRLGEEVYGLDILKVQEIVGMMPVTRVPQMPGSVRGVVNLRGRVIPVVDMRVRFDAPDKSDTEMTCIIIVRVEFDGRETTMGAVVDEVREVLDITDGQIEDMPEFGPGLRAEFLTGAATTEQGVVLLLDIHKVLSENELKAIEEAGSEE